MEQCFSRSTFFSHEIGHIGPASMWLAEAVLVIPTAAVVHSISKSSASKQQKKDDEKNAFIGLQGKEGYMFILLAGIYFTIQSLTERNHAIFGPLVVENFYEQFDPEKQTSESERTSQEALWHYMKDQQHALQALVWMSAGLVGLAFKSVNYVTGIHFVFASMAQTAMIFFHPQMNGHATVSL